MLSDELGKRVVIVDTSNEIGGDGDVPHPAIGGARRMQVPDATRQHHVMIEAVENHMPQVGHTCLRLPARVFINRDVVVGPAVAKVRDVPLFAGAPNGSSGASETCAWTDRVVRQAGGAYVSTNDLWRVLSAHSSACSTHPHQAHALHNPHFVLAHADSRPLTLCTDAAGRHRG